MAIVHCPACRKAARVPESERALSVQCPHCRLKYEAPPSLASEVIEEAELAPEPTPPPRRAVATQPQLELPDPPRRREPVPEPEPPRRREPPPRSREPDPEPAPAAGSPFDFDGGGRGGRRAVVSARNSGRERLAADEAGTWMLLAAIVDALPILGIGLLLLILVLGAKNVPDELRMVNTTVPIIICVVGVVVVTPIFIGARATRNFSSYGLSLTGAIFALLLGLGYCVFIPFALLSLLAGEFLGFLLLGMPALIGIASVIAGVKTIIVLCRQDTRERFDKQCRPRYEDDRRRRDEDEDDRPRRRRREEEDDDRRPAPRRRDDY